MLGGVTGWEKPHIGGIIQSVTIAKIQENDHLAEIELGKRAIRNLITELETMGLVETWIESDGDEGRVKQVQTIFEPQWVHDALEPYVEESEVLSRSEED